MALGRLIERLFVQVRADLSQLSGELAQGVGQTRAATQQMARQWETVSSSIENLTTDLQRGLITQGQYMSQLNRHASAVSKLGGSYREAQRQVHGYAASLRTAAAVTPVAMNPRPVQGFTRSVGQARMQMMNLGYQINDVGMTLATGMNPLTVLIQQGSQILQIYAGQGGIRTALGDISRMLVGIGKRIWPLAVMAAGFGLLTREINKTTDVSVTFMDTVGAVFQVLGRKIMEVIGGPLQELKKGFGEVLDFVVEWFTKIMNFLIGGARTNVRVIAAVWNLLPDLFYDVWNTIRNTQLEFIQGIINLVTQDLLQGILRGLDKIIQSFVFTFEAIKIIWMQLPALMQNAIGGAVNFVMLGVEKMVNASIDGINKLIAGLNALMEFVGADKALELFGFGGTINPLDSADLSQWRMETGNALTDTAAQLGEAAASTFNREFLAGVVNVPEVDFSTSLGVGRNAWAELGRQISEIMNEEMNTDFMGDFFDEVRIQAIENAMARVAAGVEDVGTAAGRAAEEVNELMGQLEEGLTKAADNLAQVFGNAFERLAETGRFTFRDFIQDMNKLIIQSTSKILQEELSNLFKKLAQSKGGLGSMLSNIFTGLFGGGNSFGARARGGVEMPWRNFVAGEEGPELVSQDGPSGARRVMTAGQTRNRMSGSSSGNINVTVPMKIDVKNYSKEPVQARKTQDNQGEEMLELMIGQVKQRMGQGEFDAPLMGRYSLDKRTNRR